MPRANLAQKANSFSKSNKLESKRSVRENKLSQIACSSIKQVLPLDKMQRLPRSAKQLWLQPRRTDKVLSFDVDRRWLPVSVSTSKKRLT